MRYLVLLLLCVILGFSTGFAQTDSVNTAGIDTPRRYVRQYPPNVLDSVVRAARQHELFVKDSLAFLNVKFPDATVNLQMAQKLLGEKLYKGHHFLDIPFKSRSILRDGRIRPVRDPWIIATVVVLLIYTGLLNITMNTDVQNVLRAFYSKRVLVVAAKEEGQINFWAFAGLFILFGLTFGLFLYQLAAYRGVYYSVSGFRLFTTLSVVVLALFAGKFLVLKFLGFVFGIQKVVAEYVSILYLTYFNIAFVFLPVVLCFSLLAVQFIPVLLTIAVILVVVIFTWLYLRSSVNIISNFRFPKFYLFIYLCALEICPVLILIKALNI